MSLQDRYIEQCTAEEVLSVITDDLVQNPVSRTLVALNAMDPDIALGKQKVAQAITAKGVSTQPTQALETMAANISSIQQETIEIDGGEMYAKQLYGVKDNSIVPGYWNLYEVMAYLLSKTSDEQYSILLCEIPKGDAEYTFGMAVTPGSMPTGFVFSDDWQLNGEGSLNIHANTEASHTWNDDLDMKGNRWVAWLFAHVVEGAVAPTVSLGAAATNCPQPRSIHIGRHMGTITATANGVLSEIVVTDGNVLDDIVGSYTYNFSGGVVIRNIGSHNNGRMIAIGTAIEKIYIDVDSIGGDYWLITGNSSSIMSSAIIKVRTSRASVAGGGIFAGKCNSLKTLTIVGLESGVVSLMGMSGNGDSLTGLQKLIMLDIDGGTIGFEYRSSNQENLTYAYVGYKKPNDTSKTINFIARSNSAILSLTDIELENGWRKNLGLEYCVNLTKSNVQDHIFDRLGVNTSGTTVTIHLAPAVYDLFTEEEIAAVTTRTSITIARG